MDGTDEGRFWLRPAGKDHTTADYGQSDCPCRVSNGSVVGPIGLPHLEEGARALC